MGQSHERNDVMKDLKHVGLDVHAELMQYFGQVLSSKKSANWGASLR